MGWFQGQSDKNKIQAKATYNGIPQTQFDNIMIREYKPLEGPAISRNDIAEIWYRKVYFSTLYKMLHYFCNDSYWSWINRKRNHIYKTNSSLKDCTRLQRTQQANQILVYSNSR